MVLFEPFCTARLITHTMLLWAKAGSICNLSRRSPHDEAGSLPRVKSYVPRPPTFYHAQEKLSVTFFPGFPGFDLLAPLHAVPRFDVEQ